MKELYDDLEPVVAVDPEAARFRMFQAVEGFLHRLSARRPLVVVIDDLHWADASSMELLVVVADRLAEQRLLVVATYRDVDPTFGPDLARTLAELARQASVHRLEVGGLDRDGLVSVLASSGAEPSDDLVSTVEHRTRGNPFFVTEILRLLPAGSGGADARSVGLAIPGSVHEVIRHRLTRLPEETRQILDACSAFDREIDPTLLTDVVDLDGATVLEHLEPALQARLLVDHPNTPGRYRFAHGLVRETLYDDLGAGRRARMHQRTALALEARFGDADGPHLVALARHWYRAVPAGPAERGIAAAIRAAFWALAHVAFDQAEEQLDAALELVATMPASRERSLLELDVLDHKSLVLIATTSYTHPAIATAAARTRDLCDELGEPLRLVPALWRLGTHHMMRGEIDRGLEVGAELVERSGEGVDDAHGAAELAGRMALGILLTQRGDIVAARVELDRAIALCDEGKDAPIADSVIEEPAVFTRVFSAINRCLLGDLVGGEADGQEALAIANRTEPGSYSATLAFWGLGMVSVLGREAAASVERSETGIEHGRMYTYPLTLYVHGVGRGWGLAALGQVDEGAAIVRSCADAWLAIGSSYLRGMYLALHADALLMGEGNTVAALDTLAEALAFVAETGEHWYLAETHRLQGEALLASSPSDVDGARTCFEQAIAVATEQQAAGQRDRAEASLAALG